MNDFLSPILIGLAIGAVAGVFVARSSARKQKIHGGSAAKIFHYLGASAFVSALPTGLIELLFGRGFGGAIVASLSLAVISLAFLLIFALFERPALARLPNENDEGWTAEKARTSGL
jgi:hypothetical protein